MLYKLSLSVCIDLLSSLKHLSQCSPQCAEFHFCVFLLCYIHVQDLKLIQKTRKISSPLSPISLPLTGRKAVKTLDESLNDDDDDDGDEVLEFERKIR